MTDPEWIVMQQRKPAACKPRRGEAEHVGDSHVFIVTGGDDEDDATFEVLHPTSCQVSLEFRPRIMDTHGNVVVDGPRHEVVYQCDVEHQIAEVGCQELKPGIYLVNAWWGKFGWPPEYDAGLDVTEMREVDR